MMAKLTTATTLARTMLSGSRRMPKSIAIGSSSQSILLSIGSVSGASRAGNSRSAAAAATSEQPTAPAPPRRTETRASSGVAAAPTSGATMQSQAAWTGSIMGRGRPG